MAHLNKVHGLFVRRGVCMRIAYLIRFLRQKGPGGFLSNYLGALLHTVQSQLSIELRFFLCFFFSPGFYWCLHFTCTSYTTKPKPGL